MYSCPYPTLNQNYLQLFEYLPHQLFPFLLLLRSDHLRIRVRDNLVDNYAKVDAVCFFSMLFACDSVEK